MSGEGSIEDVLAGRARWSVVEGDCLQTLPGLSDGSVDHVISDPPYSRDLYLHFRTNRSGVKDMPATKAFTALANEQIGAADDVAAPCVAQIKRLVKRWTLLFHDAEGGEMWRAPLGDWHVRCGVWVKGNPMPQISGDRPAQGFESLEIAHGPGRKRWNGGGLPAVWLHNAVQGNWLERRGNDHPCPKPEALMVELVGQFTDPEEVVCDPFAGSGTTGVACLRLGRRCILIERSPEFAKLARTRLRAEEQGLPLRALRETAAGQLPMFGG